MRHAGEALTSLTCGGGRGRCPRDVLAALQEKEGDGVFHIELGINGSDGGVQKRSDGTSSLSVRA